MNDTAKPALLIDSQEFRWYACFVKPRAEKATAARIAAAGVECYLPLQNIRKRWSDRIKYVEDPLIKSYVFVRVNKDCYRRINFIEGFLRFITFENKAVAIPDNQIDAIKLLLSKGVDLEVTVQNFEPGLQIEVITGPLIGLQGELIETRGDKKVLVRLGQIGQGILVTIDTKLLSKISTQL